MAVKTYRLNYRAQELRVHGTPNSFRFMADDGSADAAALAVATIIDGETAAQRVSLVKRINADASLGGAHQVGSAYTAVGTIADAAGAFWGFRARNVRATATEKDLAALLGGTASADSGIVALVTKPALPNSGLIVDHVVRAYSIKRH